MQAYCNRYYGLDNKCVYGITQKVEFFVVRCLTMAREFCLHTLLQIFQNRIAGKSSWFKHILFRRKGLRVAYNATMPYTERSFCKSI